MRVKLLDDFDSIINEVKYNKGQIVEVLELGEFSDAYADYSHGGLNWIPKDLVKDVK